jgi:hypothetical protein
MHKTLWSSEQLEGFHLAAESLKLFRRAELEDSENSAPLIRKLYVDPLPEEHIFKTVMKPSTTFIIGRKGTGKSTIFQRVQNELRGRDNTASAYVDIKTVYESSGIDTATLGRIEEISTTLSKQRLEQLLLYRSFIEATFSAIKEELKARL